jgi:D-sedoheptulose 7-phosphate isomerase
MHSNQYFPNYFAEISEAIKSVNPESLREMVTYIQQVRAAKRKIILVGNGGSAAMASHVAVDLTKNCGIRAINFNEADLITCLANDFGYEYWIEKALSYYADPGDLLILISSSGKSMNIINAAIYANKNNIKTITFSGFSDNNPLNALGNLNFWVNSQEYNVVEMTHHIWLLAVVDNLIALKK